jgi:hypothetical protein
MAPLHLALFEWLYLLVYLHQLVLSTLPKPTIDLDIPATVPVNVGFANGAFASSAV